MSEKLEAGELYRGLAGVLKDSNWLNSEALPPDQDTIVTIEAVIRRKKVKFKDETKNGYGSLRFVGKEKELGLNATHLSVLTTLFGPHTGDWFGKKIALYIDPHVQSFGKVVSAVRIRCKHIDPKAAAKNSSDRPDVEWDGPKESKSD